MKRFTSFLILFLLYISIYAFQYRNLPFLEDYNRSYVTDSPLNYMYFIYEKSVNDDITNIKEAMSEYYNKIDIGNGYPKNYKRVLLPSLRENGRIVRNRNNRINYKNYSTRMDQMGYQYWDCLNQFKKEYNKMRSYYYTKSYSKDDSQNAAVLKFTIENALESYFSAYQEFKHEIILFGKTKGFIDKNYVPTQKSPIPEMKVESNAIIFFWKLTREECSKGEENAILDFETDNFKYYRFGMPSFKPMGRAEDFIYRQYLLKKYNVQIFEAGCVIEEEKICYNGIMKKLLNDKFNKDIFKEAWKVTNTILLKESKDN